MAQVGDINSRTTTHVVCPTHYDWWCSGDLSNQCISRHGIDNQSRNIPSPAWEELINDWYTEHFRESAPRWTSQDFTNGNSTMTGGDIRNQLTLQLPSPVDPMETFSVLLALCAGNSPVPGEFPAQGPVTRCVDVFFDLRLNKRLSKQSGGWWFETLSFMYTRVFKIRPSFWFDPKFFVAYANKNVAVLFDTRLVYSQNFIWWTINWYGLKLCVNRQNLHWFAKRRLRRTLTRCNNHLLINSCFFCEYPMIFNDILHK